ncbi:acetyl-CoA carboxylase biotin carboxyl carrier protein subunit [Criibacterium bergeronii]|uniref:Acetyl-CoA carboxylase biotin carboxyl carrier protein subunit n=1 Tax=Criibacterium bergeronii TaxID=1871336 RepID=A0A552V244_9FIRM|nr:biotin/lipoyl-containing protein [Criibacterium bergeronii]TRW24528.1 acetyl-CoA carboxylase biotin carboxyl carrier protein subunit [Criibacterium bergeronii]
MRYVVNVNGKQYDVEVEKLGGTYQSLTRTTSYMQQVAPAAPAPAPVAAAPVAPVAAPAPAPAPAAAAPAGDSDVVSPMPGKIFKILVNPGDAVTEAQPVIILEAMKMENEIVAPSAGTIDKILVNIGDMVNTDDVLVTMK